MTVRFTEGPPAVATHQAAVRLLGMTKSYGGVQALRDVSFDVAPGEIRALLGENGAGKSTILKILSGVIPADAGMIEIDGKTYPNLTPNLARDAGVAMIFQEGSLVPNLTVAQNIFLNRERKDRLGLIDDVAAERQAEALFAELGVAIDPRLPVDRLSAGQRQLTEIVKAIAKKARILVLDEPSTALTENEIEHLFSCLTRLKREGVAVIYVSHRMAEIFRIADSVTILRDGEHVMTSPLAGMTMEELIERIIGRKGRGLFEVSNEAVGQGEVLLAIRNVSTSRLKNINLEVRSGEIIGIAGLAASGRSALARALFGIDQLTAGEIDIGGRRFSRLRPDDAIDNGVMLVPEDRLLQGLIADHSIADNIVLPSLGRLARWGWLKQAALSKVADSEAQALRIKAANLNQPMRSLSGGNQQKAVLAKWLALDPRVLVLDEPTAGIDIGSKTEIVALLRKLASGGRAIILISSELPELLAAANRLVVMHDGQVSSDFSRASLDMGDSTGDGIARLEHAERRLNHLIQEAARTTGARS